MDVIGVETSYNLGLKRLHLKCEVEVCPGVETSVNLLILVCSYLEYFCIVCPVY